MFLEFRSECFIENQQLKLADEVLAGVEAAFVHAAGLQRALSDALGDLAFVWR